VALWVRCFTTWSCLRVTGSFSGSSSRGGGAPGAWQSPSLLQLADKLLQRPLVSMTPIQVFVAICKAASPPLISPLVHPRLAAAARRTPDPALAAQVASAVQQVGAEGLVAGQEHAGCTCHSRSVQCNRTVEQG
jgi:hypothetical protein